MFGLEALQRLEEWNHRHGKLVKAQLLAKRCSQQFASSTTCFPKLLISKDFSLGDRFSTRSSIGD
jgi:hypothetical protein